MTDYILILVIIVLLIERFFAQRHSREVESKLLDEVSRATKAVISKNANDYVMTASIDKVAPEERQPKESDLLNEDELSDDEFINNINKQVNPQK